MSQNKRFSSQSFPAMVENSGKMTENKKTKRSKHENFDVKSARELSESAAKSNKLSAEILIQAEEGNRRLGTVKELTVKGREEAEKWSQQVRARAREILGKDVGWFALTLALVGYLGYRVTLGAVSLVTPQSQEQSSFDWQQNVVIHDEALQQQNMPAMYDDY